MNRFMRIVWSINGVGILIILIAFGAASLYQFIQNRPNPGPEVIVGNDLESAIKEGLVLQGLDFYEPHTVGGLKGYALPVHLKTLDEPNKVDDEDVAIKLENRSVYSGGSNIVNIVFLDENLGVTKVLLDKKAFISDFIYPYPEDEIHMPSIRSPKYLAYLIAFTDSNADGLIDSRDNLDFYISNLNGEALVAVTREVNVLGHEFLDDDRILVRYTDRSDTREEHKRQYFSIYHIKDKQLTPADSLNKTLETVEKQIIR